MDDIGGLDAAVKYAATAANLGDNWQLQEYPKGGNLRERFFGQVSEQARTVLGVDKVQLKAPDPLMSEFQKLQQELAILRKMNDPQGMYARLPFNLKIE